MVRKTVQTFGFCSENRKDFFIDIWGENSQKIPKVILVILFATYWKPGWGHEITKHSIKSLVFISHGYAEYLGNGYDEVAKLWCDEVGGGSLVFGHDHVGHGRTTAGERAMVNDIQGPFVK